MSKNCVAVKAEDCPAPYELLEKEIGYTFSDKSLLQNALRHSSYTNEARSHELSSNERQEFLGDSVLSLIESDHIYKSYPQLDEGDLTKIRAAVVCENSLSSFAAEIKLGSYMFLGHGEIVTHGRNRKSITADAFEALIAAIYLDGGMERAREFIMPRIEPAVAESAKKGSEDYKSKLQKIVQQTPEELLEYVPVSEEGPPHDRIFTFCVKLNSNILGYGKGRSKREAEQEAARKALEYFPDEE